MPYWPGGQVVTLSSRGYESWFVKWEHSVTNVLPLLCFLKKEWVTCVQCHEYGPLKLVTRCGVIQRVYRNI